MERRKIRKHSWLNLCLAGMFLTFVDTGSLTTCAATVDANWGGHLRGIGTVSDIDDDSVYGDIEEGRYYDGQLEFRFKNNLYWGPQWAMETHYELVALGGDTRKNTRNLENRLSINLPDSFYPSQTIDDDRRLFDLTRQLSGKEDYLVYHRLDRLNVTYTPPWGSLHLGRQALTWGDGLVFNPMDLFNPFSPTAVLRDYKVGDDMAHIALPFGSSEVQLLYLPRRDPETDDLEEEQTSYAIKYHAPVGPLEMNFMAARHYSDHVAGIGAAGDLGGAAWRVNTTYTRLSHERSQAEFFQVVANMDYAWLWGGKNVYGLVEFYYNSLGRNGDYDNTMDDISLLERLERGEVYTLGRYYFAGQLQIELHPLVRLNTTAITNLYDPSGLLQPQVLWDITGNFEAILGTQYYWGKSDTEYGGYDITFSGATIPVAPSNGVYVWLTQYF